MVPNVLNGLTDLNCLTVWNTLNSLQSQFPLRLLYVTLIRVFFRRGQRLFDYSVPKLDLDITFNPSKVTEPSIGKTLFFVK
jgi:hypothetical protein